MTELSESTAPVSSSSKNILKKSDKIITERNKRLGRTSFFQPSDSKRNTQRLPTPFESTVILLSVTSLSIGIGAGLGLGTYNYLNKSKDFRKKIDAIVQDSYQKQIDAGEQPNFKKAYTQSNLDNVRKEFVDEASNSWLVAGMVSGSVAGGLATTALATGFLGISALTGGALLLAGGLAPVVGAAIFSGLYYMVGRNRANARAKDHIIESLTNEKNMQGVDPEVKKVNEQQIVKEAENILNRIQRMQAEQEKGYSGRRSGYRNHASRISNGDRQQTESLIKKIIANGSRFCCYFLT